MKRILMLCFAVLLLCQATVFAANTPHFIPKEELCIGGISLDCPLGYVKEVYGEPTEIIRREHKTNSGKIGTLHYITYKYSDTFVIQGVFSDRRPQGEDEARITFIYVDDNSLSTPSGFTVGMPYSKVAEMFGQERQITRQGHTMYAYTTDRGGFFELAFFVDNTNTITAIQVSSQE